MISADDEQKLLHQRYNFGKFFQAHDERRGTDFVKTFPELEEFWHYCQSIKI